MATNLSSANGTAYNTVNMKPDSDDQGDVLWAQNLSDNTAFSAYKKEPAFAMGPWSSGFSAASGEIKQLDGTTQYLHNKNMGTLSGTCHFTNTGMANESMVLKFDGTTIISDSGFSGTVIAFNHPISGFPTGSHGIPIDVTLTFFGTSDSASDILKFQGVNAWLTP